MPITSTSPCPAPTVSRKSRSLPDASSTSIACSVASASPPRWPRVPIERMKTSGSRKWSLRRMRSPSSAPCVNGLDGSTEIDADALLLLAHVADERADQATTCRRRAGPVTPTRTAAGVGIDVADDSYASGVAVLDERDRARERALVARAHAGGERLPRPVSARRQAARCSGLSAAARAERRASTAAPRRSRAARAQARRARAASSRDDPDPAAPSASVTGPAAAIAGPSTA